VFAEVKRRKENAVLLLVGDGDLRAEMEQKAKTLGIADSVIFTGVRSDVHRYYQAMDVFVFPSIYEGLGIVAIEAQASGLPCFTALDCVPEEANVTGTVEYLPLEAGAAAWAEAILGAQNDQHARKSNVDVLCRQGYDIIAEAEKLQQFYLQKTVEAP
jgi:glycosyltransferase involved in cell wall biosynthesis